MKQPRLLALLAVMGVLLALRWLVPPTPTVPQEVVAALPRSSTSPAESVARMVAESNRDTALPAASTEDDVQGNAFAVRAPPAPPPAPPPPRAPRVKRVAVVETPPPVSDPVPPPPPPPPLQVIGTWNDGGLPAVFLAGPQGTLMARQGTVLLSEYQVTQIDAHQLSLIHLVSRHEWQLPLPRVQATP